MTLETEADLFEYQLRSAYYVERQLVDALDELQTSATEGKLVDALAEHRDETVVHVERLEEAFDLLGIDATEENVPSVDGLLQEKREFDAQAQNEALQNRFYNQAARQAERMELTMYEGLLALADELDVADDVRDLLEQSRREEAAALDELDSLSEGSGLLDKLR
jgi:ferritin-like metal-binding protein YciE